MFVCILSYLDHLYLYQVFASTDLLSLLEEVKNYIVALNLSDYEKVAEAITSGSFNNHITITNIQKVENDQTINLENDKCPILSFTDIEMDYEKSMMENIMGLKTFVNDKFLNFEKECLEYFDACYSGIKNFRILKCGYDKDILCIGTELESEFQLAKESNYKSYSNVKVWFIPGY